MSDRGRRRAVVTGIGVVAPNGVGTAAWWQATVEGRSGIKRITRFDPSRYSVQVAGEIDDFEAADYVEGRLLAQTDRWTQLGLAAAQMALEDAAFTPSAHDPYSMSVITASSSDGIEFGQREMQNLWGKAPIFVGAYASIAHFHAATTAQISIKYGMKGPGGVISSEGAGGLEALAQARRAIRRGTNAVISGGVEAPLSPYALSCLLRGNLNHASDVGDAFHPFTLAACGSVPGEGGAILLVEDLEAAQRRGAPRIYGEIAGYGATNDAYHHARPAPDGRQFARAMSLALHDAGVDPTDVDVLFADAAGTREGDALEVRAIQEVFGQDWTRVPVTAPKSMVGRLSAGGAPLDVAAALLSMRDGCIPPTVTPDEPAAIPDLNLVTETRIQQIRTALINARGYGGFNAAMVVVRPDPLP